MSGLDPRAWWRGLAGLTRSGSAVEALSWALYDFANTIFSFAIVSFAMSLWSIAHLGEAAGQFWFTVAFSASVLVNAAVSPVLGALSDRAGRRKPFLAAFTLLCIAPTLVIGLVDIGLGLILFGVANFGYQAALIYYDALLPSVARDEARGRLSGIGVALGYVGTIVAGLLYRVTTDAAGGSTPASFVLVGALFAAFALPLFALVAERGATARLTVGDAVRSWAQLRTTIRHARQVPGLLRFILGRLVYTDPVNTAIVVMSAFAVGAIGFTPGQALLILLLLTAVAVVASFGWGFLVDRWGPKRTLLVVLGSWSVGLLVIGLFLAPIPFLIAGAILGSGLGGVGVTDRLLLLRLAPRDRVGEMLGLYGLAGKFSAVVGPFLYGSIVGLLLDRLGQAAYQVAILSLLVLMLAGLWIVRAVPDVGLAPDRDATPLEPAIVPPGEQPA
ncbi:MAG: MFS transporter [Chloroflexota bacterium]|nr:MFS transporter [Chloroflexota bacterium]